MKKPTLILLALITLLITGCEKDTYQLNQEFELDFNESAFVALDGSSLKIKFTKLVEESRCRPGTECIWQGQVAVEITVNDSQTYTIGTETYAPSVLHDGRMITLIEASYGKDKNYGKEKHYTIRLKVE